MREEREQKEFGNRIAECRRQREMTQEELASRLGVTAQALSQYERGLRYPDLGLIKPMCRILKVSADYLLQIEDSDAGKDGELQIQSEIWRNLRKAVNPLGIGFGEEILPVILEADLKMIADLRIRLSRQGILMPVVRVYDELSLKPREFRVMAYNKVLYQEIISPEIEISLEYIVRKLEETVLSRYDEILSVDMVKDLTDNLRISYPALIEGIVPEQISYSQLTGVCRAFVRKGNTIRYLPQILEGMEMLLRDGIRRTDEEIAETIAAQLTNRQLSS